MPPQQSTVNCMKCQHFYITWDKNFPRGCKFFNFKTKQMPSAEVKQSSGTDCLKYEPKA